jgi:DNA modification methylase
MNVLDQKSGVDWTLYHADCVPVLASLPSNSVHFTVYSPPFASLYTYSASERDMGNCASHSEFFAQFQFLLGELQRVTKPGRNMSMHVMDLPTSKTRDGQIGLTDFPGDCIRAAQAAGWIWHSKVTIRKDPVTAMQRTKALGLLHKQIKKDSCMSRMGIPDYVLTFRKPGENPERVSHTSEDFPVSVWQQWAEPIWRVADSATDLELLEQWAGLTWDDIDQSDTLQHRSAREDEDERHIAPLQLEVIRRCIRMWSNPGDVVLSPFAGIASEGHVALNEGRKFVGCELKKSYFEQACRNLAKANKQTSLFEHMAVTA